MLFKKNVAFVCVIFTILAITFLVFCTSSANAQSILLKGRVMDFDSKQPIAGVSVSVPSLKKGTTTDTAGYFQIVLEVNKYEIKFSFTGYKDISRTVYLLDEHDILVELKRSPPSELPEVVVESRRKDANVTEAKMSTVNINLAQLRKAPLVFGEADILKALVLQTGITTVGEGAGGFNVRGGNSDQNLVLLDGAPLFNTSHLLGFYSTISPDAVKDFTLYKGAFPASFGGRLSSLASMNIKPGNDSKIRYSSAISPISAHLFAEGPVNNKLTFLAGGRIAYPKLIMNQFPGSVSSSNAFFYDMVGKLSYKVNDKNRLSISLYRSYDMFKFTGDTSYTWQSNIATLNWRSELTKKLVLTFNANYSQYISDINGLTPFYQFRLRNSIEHLETKINLGYQATDKAYFEGGANIIRHVVRPGSLKPGANSSNINPNNLQQELGNEYAGYFLTRLELTKSISFEGGLRYSGYADMGAQTIYEYAAGQPKSSQTITDSVLFAKGKTIVQYQGLEPRALLKFGLSDQASIKLSYTRTRQYLQLISNTIAITPVDYWKLCDPLIKPAIADQYAAGLFQNFRDNTFETSLEGFYKLTQNLVDYKNGANLSLNPYLDADLLAAKGKAYGLEFNLRKVKGKFTGQLAYTWSRSLIADISPFAVEQVNGGTYYPSNYDRPFNLSLTGKIILGKGWDFDYVFVYITGRPVTYPDGTYVINNTVVTNYSVRNADRLPDYNRLDISFSHDSRRFAEQKRYTILNFSIYNLYARKNPYSIYFQRDGGSLDSYQLSVLGTFIPSITWNYYF